MIKFFKEFEGIKWYKKGEFEKDLSVAEETAEETIFNKGENIVLVNPKNSYWDTEKRNFRDSRRGSHDRIMTVLSGEIKTIDGFPCVECKFSGWYKVDCVKKIKEI
jgi:hypothetical protein